MNRFRHRAIPFGVLLALTVLAAFAQPTSPRYRSKALWAPPDIDLPDLHPEPNIPREMIGKVQVGSTPIVLNQTSRAAAQRALGGTVGVQGDAGDWEAWLCYHGHDSGGRWMLWLLSSEVDNENVSGLLWMHLTADEVIDPRCRFIPGDNPIRVPISLRSGISESEVRQVLGKPTLISGDLLEYSHEHHEMIDKLDFTVTNDVNVVLKSGKVRLIQVWRSEIN